MFPVAPPTQNPEPERHAAAVESLLDKLGDRPICDLQSLLDAVEETRAEAELVEALRRPPLQMKVPLRPLAVHRGVTA